jgi:hypothetical protein
MKLQLDVSDTVFDSSVVQWKEEVQKFAKGTVYGMF